MATSILRLGRLGYVKCLRLESWGILRSHPAMMFCSEAENTTKSTTKIKAASETGAQDERATLLAYKTAVAFPVRFSKPEVSSAQSLGVAEPVSSSAAAAAAAAAHGPVADAGEPVGAVPQTEDITATSLNLAPDPDISHMVSDNASDTTQAAEPPSSVSEGTVPLTKASSEPHDPVADGSSSSSSSDSDSESDSDSDDEKSKANTPTSPPKMSESAMKEETKAHEVTSELKYGTDEDNKEAPSKHKDTPVSAVEAVQEMASSSPAAAASTVKAAEATLETPCDSSEELVDSAPVFCTAAEDTLEVTPTVPDAHRGTPAEDVAEMASPEKNTEPAHSALIPVEAATSAPVEAAVSAPVEAAVSAPVEAATSAPVEVEASAPVEAAVSAPVEAAASAPVEAAVSAPVEVEASAPVEAAEVVSVEAATKPLEVEIAPTEAAAEHAAEHAAHMESSEELMDPAQVIAEGAGADPQAEITAEEQNVAPPEPEEPFDNSTYKNQQHHSYTPFTFVDLDVEMAKFRLPQPSSGRPSPRH